MANRIVYLKTAIVDLHWFRHYYEDYFPEGLAQANASFEKCLRLVAALPRIGRTAGKSPRRRFSIPKAPFTIVYQEKGDVVEVLRILDQRSQSYLNDLFETL
jgi:plasmid stabilization system protein ParE